MPSAIYLSSFADISDSAQKASLEAELRFAEANCRPGLPYRVARVVDAAPRLGLIAIEAAPG